MAKKFDYDSNPWLFEGKPFTDEDIGDFTSFVYLLVIDDGEGDEMLYIGRKRLYSMTKKKGAKRRSKGPSNWKNYWSSSDAIKEYRQENGVDNITRHILSLHTTDGDAHRREVATLWQAEALEDARFLNLDISGKWRPPPEHIVASRKESKQKQELLERNSLTSDTE